MSYADDGTPTERAAKAEIPARAEDVLPGPRATTGIGAPIDPATASESRPPWVVVILLPDDMPPALAACSGLAIPWGARGVALAAEPAEAVIAALPEEYRR